MNQHLEKIGKWLLGIAILGIILILSIFLFLGIYAQFVDPLEISGEHKIKWLLFLVFIACAGAFIFFHVVMRKVVEFHRSRWTDFEPQIWYRENENSPKEPENAEKR